MRFRIYDLRIAITTAMAIATATRLGAASQAFAETALAIAGTKTNDYLIDLPTALQLAGARNLDLQIARQRLAQWSRPA